MAIVETGVCVNTRDTQSGLNKCWYQLYWGSSCVNFLEWKSCDVSCGLCACSTGYGSHSQHCSGHGKCIAECGIGSCIDAYCRCDYGWIGDKCEIQGKSYSIVRSNVIENYYFQQKLLLEIYQTLFFLIEHCKDYGDVRCDVTMCPQYSYHWKKAHCRKTCGLCRNRPFL